MSKAAEETTKEKAERLNNWRTLDVHRWSDYPEINTTVDLIYKELEGLPDFKGKPNIQKKHIKVIILDLYAAFLEDPDKYIGVYRGVSYYEGKSRYNKLHITKLTPTIIDRFIELGYIDQVKGHYDATGNTQSHMTRIIHTNKLKALWSNSGFKPEMIDKAPDTECIILRKKDDGKKVDTLYSDTPETIKMRNDLRKYNNLLRSRHIGIPHYPPEGVKIDVRYKGKTSVRHIKLNKHDKFIRRIFKDDFEHGGRYYGGWWQRIPKEWREEIRIDRVPTIELDYSGLHIVLLYAKHGIDYWSDIESDPYTLTGFPDTDDTRSLLKLILLVALNADNKTSAIRAIRDEINKNPIEYGWVKDLEINIKDLIDGFTQLHHPIESEFYSGVGTTLQRIDSDIAEYVINDFTKYSNPILCIHDSFIVQNFLEEQMMVVMGHAINNALVSYGWNTIDQPKVKLTVLSDRERWGNVMGDKKSLIGVIDIPTGDKQYDKESSKYDFQDDEYETYYRDT